MPRVLFCPVWDLRASWEEEEEHPTFHFIGVEGTVDFDAYIFGTRGAKRWPKGLGFTAGAAPVDLCAKEECRNAIILAT